MSKKFEQDRYKNNLTVVGNKIFSYGTHVADIDHKKKRVVKLGYWSMTTSKHINYVASKLGYESVDPQK